MKVDLNKSCNLCVWERISVVRAYSIHPSCWQRCFFYCVVESYHLRMWDFLIKNKKNQQKHTNNKCLMKQDFKCTFSWTDRNSNQLSFFFRLMFLCSFVQSVFLFLLLFCTLQSYMDVLHALFNLSIDMILI